MNMTDEMLEILIGKYLDGEMTPSERNILEAALEGDSEARELFERLQDLHQSGRQVVASEICRRGKAAEEIFEQAWRQQTNRSARRVMKVGGHLRFAAGLAAGLVIGYAVHFAPLMRSTPQSSQTPPSGIARELDNLTDVHRPALLMLPSDGAGNVIRNVDWYSFTDEAGDQWLIEGFRESIVRPAVYHGGL